MVGQGEPDVSRLQLQLARSEQVPKEGRSTVHLIEKPRTSYARPDPKAAKPPAAAWDCFVVLFAYEDSYVSIYFMTFTAFLFNQDQSSTCSNISNSGFDIKWAPFFAAIPRSSTSAAALFGGGARSHGRHRADNPERSQSSSSVGGLHFSKHDSPGARDHGETWNVW